MSTKSIFTNGGRISLSEEDAFQSDQHRSISPDSLNSTEMSSVSALLPNNTALSIALEVEDEDEDEATLEGQIPETSNNNVANSETLDLSGTGISDEGMNKIVSMINSCNRNTTATPLKRVNLGNNLIGDGGIQKLIPALKGNSTVASLLLQRNSIGSGGLFLLAQWLCQPICQFNELNLNYNSVGSSADDNDDDDEVSSAGIIVLAHAISVNKTLRVLELRQANLSAADSEALAKALESNKTIHTVNLSDNNFSNKAAEAFGNTLQVNSVITTLALRNCGITDVGCSRLVEGIAKNCSLTKLDLANNQIKDNGAKGISTLLRRNSTLLSLNLSSTGITSQGMVKIAFTLEKRNSTLTRLNMSSNYCGDDTAWAWANVLRHNSTLRQLALEDCGIMTKGGEELLGALQLTSNTALCRLSIGGPQNGIPNSIRNDTMQHVNHNLLDQSQLQQQQNQTPPPLDADQAMEPPEQVEVDVLVPEVKAEADFCQFLSLDKASTTAATAAAPTQSSCAQSWAWPTTSATATQPPFMLFEQLRGEGTSNVTAAAGGNSYGLEVEEAEFEVPHPLLSTVLDRLRDTFPLSTLTETGSEAGTGSGTGGDRDSLSAELSEASASSPALHGTPSSSKSSHRHPSVSSCSSGSGQLFASRKTPPSQVSRKLFQAPTPLSKSSKKYEWEVTTPTTLSSSSTPTSTTAAAATVSPRLLPPSPVGAVKVGFIRVNGKLDVPEEFIQPTSGKNSALAHHRGWKLCQYDPRCKNSSECKFLHIQDYSPMIPALREVVAAEREQRKLQQQSLPEVKPGYFLLNGTFIIPQRYVLETKGRQVALASGSRAGNLCWHDPGCAHGKECTFLHLKCPYEEVVNLRRLVRAELERAKSS